MEHHVPVRSFAQWSDFPLRVPNRAERHRPQQAEEVVASVSPLHIAVSRIVLPQNISEHGSLNGMAYGGSHKRIAVALTAQFSQRLCVVLKPVAVQCVPCPGFRNRTKRVHYARVIQG